jgi:DNA-binding NarL/FixJ family response regulator/class 3 adenylate cyclase
VDTAQGPVRDAATSITFLFTDVEGSTRLAERFPHDAAEILARHQALIAEAVEQHHGRVFERVGDAAYAAFDDAAEAVLASIELGAALSRADWQEVGHLRVRAALDTGDAERRGDRFFGAPLFRAARVLSLAHGGETLLTDAVLEAAAGRLPGEWRPRDLGRHRLRDITEPVHVFQLLHTAHAVAPDPGYPGSAARVVREVEEMETDEGPIRVMLVDDHAVVRRGLKGFLELLRDIEIVGEAEDGEEAVALADRLQPDVILMDLLMPKMDGITAIGHIKAVHPGIEIVAVTSFIEEQKVTSALEAGASGYLLKDAEAEEVADAIRAAHRGEVHLDPAVARVLAQRIRERKQEEPVEPLTDREREVLGQVATGASNKEIAAALGITERTARTHVSNILGKLGLASRTQAALWAVDHGMAERTR